MHVDQTELRTKVPCLESRFLLASMRHFVCFFVRFAISEEESGFLLANSKSDKKTKHSAFTSPSRVCIAVSRLHRRPAFGTQTNRNRRPTTTTTTTTTTSFPGRNPDSAQEIEIGQKNKRNYALQIKKNNKILLADKAPPLCRHVENRVYK